MKGTGLLVRTGKWARTVGWVCWPSAICSYLPFAVRSLEDICEGRNGREKKKPEKSIVCVEGDISSGSCWIWSNSWILSNQLCRNTVLHHRKWCLPIHARACPDPSHFDLQQNPEDRFAPGTQQKTPQETKSSVSQRHHSICRAPYLSTSRAGGMAGAESWTEGVEKGIGIALVEITLPWRRRDSFRGRSEGLSPRAMCCEVCPTVSWKWGWSHWSIWAESLGGDGVKGDVSHLMVLLRCLLMIIRSITEPLRLKRSSKIIQSNREPIPTMSTDHIPWCHTSTVLGHLQVQWLHHLPGQLCLCLTAHLEKFFPMSNLICCDKGQHLLVMALGRSGFIWVSVKRSQSGAAPDTFGLMLHSKNSVA